MEWKLSQEQEDYRDALRDWLADTAPVATVRRWLDSGDISEFERRYAADGMAGVGIDERLGGQGGGVVELALTAEELARAAAPSAAWMATVLAVPALAGRAEVVAEAIEGSSPAAVLVPAERVPSSAPWLRVDDQGRVSGRAARVLGADRAGTFVAPVRAADGRVALRLVTADGPGVAVRRRSLLDRTRSVADVTLDDAPSAALDVDATAVLDEMARLAAVLTAADSLGAMQRMLDMAVEYSGQRRQFGVPIGSFQAVKHAAVSILVGVEAGRSGVYYAAASLDRAHEDRLRHAAAVKAQVTAAGSRAADTALTIHGAIGYTWEHDLHLFYKRARLDEYLFGSPAVWNDLLADSLRLV
ncbi:MAG: acyl-CoA dehydrogenase family protein [Thermocrispum agreste]|uniref:Acyl-CoA dehydrogenase n=1 Tax=Thermocrispum agreste TaxID=37925 RepID=A0A2W4LJS6_9PSEU|nr:MAG: acyl-CoA dehydrogenase [Thermocrispum agreste]